MLTTVELPYFSIQSKLKVINEAGGYFVNDIIKTEFYP